MAIPQRVHLRPCRAKTSLSTACPHRVHHSPVSIASALPLQGKVQGAAKTAQPRETRPAHDAAVKVLAHDAGIQLCWGAQRSGTKEMIAPVGKRFVALLAVCFIAAAGYAYAQFRGLDGLGVLGVGGR